MHKDTGDDFSGSQKREFFIYGTSSQMAKAKARIVFDYYRVRIELLFKALKNKFWIA